MLNTNILTQAFNSPKVNLEIESFKDMKFWKQQMEMFDIKDIWSFIKWLMPVGMYNIHNYQLIQDRFIGFPDNERVLDLLSQEDNPFYCVVKVNLNNPTLGCHITIYKDCAEAQHAPVYVADTYLISNGKKSFALQDYLVPGKINAVTKATPFTFYKVFGQYASLGSTNLGKRTLCLRNEAEKQTDKTIIVAKRRINWRGISFENSIPSRDRSRNLYHVITDSIRGFESSDSFFTPFRELRGLIDDYVVSANGNKSRINNATRFIPVPYTKSDYLMRDMRASLNRLGIMAVDMEAIFTPYLEVGESMYEFVFGIVSR